MKLKMLNHVVRRSSTLRDVAAYLTLMCREFDYVGEGADCRDCLTKG